MNKNIAPRRRQQHVGVLSDGIWSAHSRLAGDNGVPAPTTTSTDLLEAQTMDTLADTQDGTDFDDFESFITRRWASEARVLSQDLATGTPLNRERLGMALDNLAAIAEREANKTRTES